MTEWHTIPAKFTSEEKRVLDVLRDSYGLNYNKSLRTGVELLARLMAMVEYYQTIDSKIMKKVSKVGNKTMKQMDFDVKKILEKIPAKQQQEEYEKLMSGRETILSQFDRVFVKNRKKGRNKIRRKKGRPSTRLE